jgi:hypothetical protein
MPMFITYASYSQSGAKGLIDKPADRSGAIKALIEKVGGKLIALYFTTGSNDVVLEAAQPNGTPQLGEVHPVRRPFLSANQNDTPAALSPLRRQNPREEPGALAAHAGICTGGGWQRPSLP